MLPWRPIQWRFVLLDQPQVTDFALACSRSCSLRAEIMSDRRNSSKISYLDTFDNQIIIFILLNLTKSEIVRCNTRVEGRFPPLTQVINTVRVWFRSIAKLNLRLALPFDVLLLIIFIDRFFSTQSEKQLIVRLSVFLWLLTYSLEYCQYHHSNSKDQLKMAWVWLRITQDTCNIFCSYTGSLIK